MLNCIPPSLRTLGNSVANLIYNLFGYLPAPFVYALAYEMSGGSTAKSRWGLGSLEIYGILAAISMVLLLWIRYSRVSKEKKKLNQYGKRKLSN